MAELTFDQLLNTLPHCDVFPIREELPRGVSCDEEENSRFIAPNLSIVEGVEEYQQCQVLIVSAPGAVGKSTLGRAIAGRKNAVFWDLAAADEVGSNSLDGMLYNVLKEGEMGLYWEYVEEGLQFVIVDALDEGRIKVNEGAFGQLLRNIGDRAKNSKGIAFILLGRTLIAEDAWLELDNAGVKATILAIEPFDRNQAIEYISKNASIESEHMLMFEECRDLLFTQLAFSVSDGSDSGVVQDFLHYPPVLDVIVKLLEGEKNYYKLKNALQAQIDGNAGEVQSLDLLREVIGHILVREQEEKFLSNVKPSLDDMARQVAWSDWDALYTPHEQSKRLLSSVLGSQIDDTPTTVPGDLRAAYEEKVREWLPQHPFLQSIEGRFANSVFRSYLYAKGLRGDFGGELQNRVTETLLDQKQLPETRLLADFYLEDHGSRQSIAPEHLGILYDSLISSESNRAHIRLNLDGDDPRDTEMSQEEEFDIEGEFEFLSHDDGQLGLVTVPFKAKVNRDSTLSFGRYLRNADITVPCTVEFGSSVSEFRVGPAVSVVANRIKFASESLVVVVGGRAKLKPDEESVSRVILECLCCDWEDLVNQPIVYDTGEFSVSWLYAERYPWTQYRRPDAPDELADSESLHQAYRRFKRIATAFRSHGRGSLARTKRKIEHRRVLQGNLGETLLSTLVSDGILSLGDGGGRYFWNPEKADSFLGVSWANLRNGEIPPTLLRYLSTFVEQHPDLFRL